MEFDYSLQPGRVLNKKKVEKCVKPLVSIITAFYNAGTYFEQTYRSVMNQTFPWFEWVIVNDGSTKEQDVKLLNELAETDFRITIINQENKGVSHARNVGLYHAKTDIIIPLDADDLLEPQYVEYVFWGLYYNPDAAWCYTQSVGFQAEEYVWNFPWNTEQLKTYNYLILTAAIRKKDMEEVGGYQTEENSYFEDWRFWLDLLGRSKKPVSLGGNLFWYRRLSHGRLSTTRKDEAKEALAEQFIKEAAEHVDLSVQAKEYPLNNTNDPFYMPQAVNLGDEYVIKQDSIHLLLIIPWITVGGADQFNLDLAENLSKSGFEISIMTTVRSENRWHQRFAKSIRNIFHLPEFLDPAYYLDFISYYIKAKSVDSILVTNSYKGYYMLPWLRKKFPKICIIDYVHMEEWYWKAGGYARISGRMGQFLDQTYVCNGVTREVMIERFERDKDHVKTMHVGVNTDELSPERIAGGYLYSYFSLPRSKQIILFPCRIHPQKRPFLMLEIAELVCSEHADAVFVVAGDGEQLQELQDEIRCRNLQDAVLCTGYSDRMKECYRDAKLTLICSLKEGLSLTAYESCAMGVPVISSDVGGQKDLIDDTVGRLIKCMQDEECAFDRRRFDRREVEEFAEAILLFLKEEGLYAECSSNCRKKVENAFSTKEMARKMEEEIRTLCSDQELAQKHAEMSNVLHGQGKYAEEFYTSYLMLEEREQAFDELLQMKCELEKEMRRREREGELGEVFRRLGLCEESVNRHEEVVNRHEEVVNRHEEVVNRHEQVVNDDWAWLKDHEARMRRLEDRRLGKKVIDMLHRQKK